MRMFSYLAIAVVAILVAVIAVTMLGARLSLDRSFSHTRKAAALPAYEAGQSDGLVRIAARGMEFRARVAGMNQDGPALILLHGFPETSWMWKPLLARASEAGFRVVAFDQRGYSPGARPSGVDAYLLPELIADVLHVADAVGFEDFHLIGHDWGSIVGWHLTGDHPDRVLSWASLSIAHPGAIRAASNRDGPPTYVKVFRMTGVVENLFSWGNRLLMRALLYRPIPESDLEEYLAAFAEPGALTAALNWYRAQVIPEQVSDVPIVTTPTTWIYGSRDMETYTGPRVRERMREFVTGPYHELELDAGHWLIQEQTTAVVDALLAHLDTHRPRA